MKRFLGSMIVALTGIAVILAMPFASSYTAQAVGLNDFAITNYEIVYTLSRDENRRSILTTEETITADFTHHNRNHGIERAIPTQYDGHRTGLDVTSVTNENGDKLNYEIYSESGFDVIRIGDADTYVNGLQTYKMSYSQNDVTKFYSDTNRDEWYWDTNGTEWNVPIERLLITTTIDAGLRDYMENGNYCYKGTSGSTTQCSVNQLEKGKYVTQVTNLSAGENVTLAFGFAPNTFAAYQPTLAERMLAIWGIVTAVTGVLATIIVIGLSVAYARRRNRSKELDIIPVEYIPPKHTSPIIAAQVVLPSGSVFGAQLIDLAVRHIIKIIEMKPAKFWSLAEYDIEMLVDSSTQLEETKEVLSDMWGHEPKAGERLSLKSLRNNTQYAARTLDNDKKIKLLIEGSYDIRYKSPVVSKYFYNWSWGLLVVGIITLSIPLLITAGIVAIMGSTIRPLTDKGLELRRYLLGLDKYIKAAEAERLKFLQGPDTAQKVGEKVDTDNPGQMVKLYERVLPYAILFGHEKEWTKQLGNYYQTASESPNWYTGSTAFNAALFATSVSSFSNAAGYSGGSSSSSGGSSGGGSSGGGGGGGGGGGW